MLNLKRKIGEALIINEDIEITLVSVTKKGATIGVLFPRGTSVLRKEIFLKIKQENVNSSQIDIDLLSRTPNNIDE